jgi:putative molybdopterin biosynthesis protein
MSRNLYLKVVTLDQAKQQYQQVIQQLPLLLQTETVKVTDALDRITAQAVFAKVSSPLYDCAAMDGIMTNSHLTSTASETSPVILTKIQDYQEVDTGDPLLSPFNTVIMAEDLIVLDDNRVKIIAAATPYQHVRPIGEDIVAQEMILPSYHKIRPMDVGVLISGGISQVVVIKRLRVGIIPTGSEIVELNDDLKLGDIIESNAKMFAARVSELGGIPTCYPIVPDNRQLLTKTIQQAINEQDLVIVNAGSSAGREDYTSSIISELGEVIVHGVAIKPGKPAILATINHKPVIGIPGYPVSAYIVFEEFVTPLLAYLQHQSPASNPLITATITKRIVSSLKHQEYVRVKVGWVNNQWVATPLQRGAGAAMSLVKADGFLIIPLHHEGYEAGQLVQVILYHDLAQLKNTLVIVGSHDLLLDIADDIAIQLKLPLRLSSSHVGSMGGLVSLRNHECTIAPVHLLDENTGRYNQHVQALFKEPIALIKGVKRIQGLIVAKDNPLQITCLDQLPNYRYVNRQRGAGTRILLDYLLKTNNIDPASIDGYDHELATHMAVAASVKNQSADCGMGILSAAKALGLDFIPLGEEEYDFVVYVRELTNPAVEMFISLLQSQSFKQQLAIAGGYDTTDAGEVVLLA